ncbi:MAG: hypothetical protein VX436_02965 [Planctomycetota bacterium]|nr:hypothetical protein [Planctomycetota bacterium]
MAALFCLLSNFSKSLYAQAIPVLTDPLKVQQIELLSEKLSMTLVQQESMLELYDRYLVDFARVRNGDVKTFEDSITKAAEDFGFMSLNIPERAVVEKLITQFDRSIKSIQRVDKLFFNEISGMLTESQQRRLGRYKISREVEAYMALKMVGEFNRGAGVHISELYEYLHIEETPEVLQVLETYEKRYLNLAKSTYDALTETVRIALDMVDELEVRGLDQQALMMKFMNEEAIEDLKRRGDILLIPLQRVAFEISQLNWKTWKLLDELLPEKEARTFQQLYFSKSYFDAVQGFQKVNKKIERALEYDGVYELQEDQKLSLLELRNTFHRSSSVKSRKHAELIEKSREHRSIAQFSREEPGKYDEELNAARTSRDKLLESTHSNIDGILGEDIDNAINNAHKHDTEDKKYPNSEVKAYSTATDEEVAIEINADDRIDLASGVEIPRPIGPSFAKRAAVLLDLEASGEMIINAVYDEYREQYDLAFESVKSVNDSIENDATLVGGARLRKIRDSSKSAAQSIALLDIEFFNNLAAVTSLKRDNASLLMLENHRQRQREEPSDDQFGWSGGRNAVIDLVDLFVLSKDSNEIFMNISQDGRKIISKRMEDYHQQIVELHSNLTKARYSLAHMQDAMYLVEESEDDASNARMAESIQRRWRDAFIEIRNANKAMVFANQSFMDELLGKLQEDDYWIIRMKYVKTAYPDVFKDGGDASTMLTAALAIQDLDLSQQSALEQLSSSYKYDYWNLSEGMVSLRQSDANLDSGEQFFTQDDIRREIRLETLRFERGELNDRVRMRLRMILNTEQIKKVPGLHPSIAAARDEGVDAITSSSPAYASDE